MDYYDKYLKYKKKYLDLNKKLLNAKLIGGEKSEYIDFDLVNLENDKHKCVAQNVTGVKGGIIMCETRRLDTNSGTPAVNSYSRVSQSADGFTKVEKRRKQL